MEVTPELLNGQGFRETRRGYDQREVDEFLERVAVGVARLRERLGQTESRVAQAEAQATDLQRQLDERPDTSATDEVDETLRRTLVLAQKTADAAVKEAEETAARTVASGQEQAEFVLREAREAADRLRNEAEAQARRSGEETRRRVLDEIASLEASREALSADIRALRRYLDDQRARLRTAARDLQRLADDPTALKEVDPPVLSTLPSDASDEVPEDEPEAEEGDAEETDLIEPLLLPPTDEDVVGDASEVDLESVVADGWADEEPADDDDADYFEDLRRAISDPDDDTPDGDEDGDGTWPDFGSS